MTLQLLRNITSNAFFPTVINIYENAVIASFISNDANMHLCTNQYSHDQYLYFIKYRHYYIQDFWDFNATKH